MYCPKCGHSVPDNAEFCPECGTRIKRKANTEQQKQFRFCPNCGQKISENTAFCPKCGAKIGRNIAERTERTGSGTFDNYRAKKLQKKNKKWFACIIAIALIVCLVIGLAVRSSNNGYQKGVENTVDFINMVFHVEDPDEIDSNYMKKILRLVLPESIVDESTEVIEIVSRSRASEEAVSQEEELQALLLNDHQMNAPIKLKKIESATKLNKSELKEYQERINNDFSSFVKKDLMGDVPVNSDDFSEYADYWEISEDDARTLFDDLTSISEKIKKMKITNGYRVRFSYLSDEGQTKNLSMDFLYVDGTWVPDQTILG